MDIYLPPGYSSFQFKALEMTFSASDQLAFYVNYDYTMNGIKDMVNSDTYSVADFVVYQSVAGLDFNTYNTGLGPSPGHGYDVYADDFNAWDGVGYLGPDSTNFDWYMDFTPGDSTHYFKGMVKIMADKLFSGGGGGYGFANGAITLNPSAVAAPAKDRVKAIRFGPYRNLIGTDTTHKIQSGKWYLFGIKD